VNLKLQIQLKSDASPGIGEGEAGGIDRDITHNPNGVPIITARRIKGCWREATTELLEALEQTGKKDLFAENLAKDIFGQQGQYGSGWLKVGAAYPEKLAELEEWLTWIAHKDSATFGAGAVKELFTGLRTQTAIARHSGGILPNTLRVSRVIARSDPLDEEIFKPQIFVASVELETPFAQTKAAHDLLALSCAAFRHLGTARNRGLGEVEVTLWKDTENLTKTALEQLPTALGLGES
jgi:CRISPR-associated protein Csx10